MIPLDGRFSITEMLTIMDSTKADAIAYDFIKEKVCIGT